MIVLHGAGVDHREAQACFEPILATVPGLRRVYPDLPGMGRSPAPEHVRSTDDVLHVLLDFARIECGSEPMLLVGHSWGAFLARAMAARLGSQVSGLAVVCPLVADVVEIPEPRIVAGGGIGDEVFRDYFVVQTPAMLERYERFVAPAAALVDEEAMARIGENWGLSLAAPPYGGPTLIVAGRLDANVGYAGALALVESHPHATLAVLDDTGHALPHEEPELLGVLMRHWLARVDRDQVAD